MLISHDIVCFGYLVLCDKIPQHLVSLKQGMATYAHGPNPALGVSSVWPMGEEWHLHFLKGCKIFYKNLKKKLYVVHIYIFT